MLSDVTFHLLVFEIFKHYRMPVMFCNKMIGKNGIEEKANGIDNNPVEPLQRKSTSLPKDTTDIASIKSLIEWLKKPSVANRRLLAATKIATQ
jgi:hypothetical protein